MSIPPPNPPADAFAAFVRWLSHAVITRRLMGLFAAPVADDIIDRLRVAKGQLARLAARLQAGTWRPRRITARQPEVNPEPRPKIPRRRPFGWLRPLLPDAVHAAGYLDHLLQDPAMVALMQAAPAPAARILRPLCWMLRMKPPPVLAPPRRRDAPAPAPEASPPPAPAITPPGTTSPGTAPPGTTPRLRARSPARPVPARGCGPPRPA